MENNLSDGHIPTPLVVLLAIFTTIYELMDWGSFFGHYEVAMTIFIQTGTAILILIRLIQVIKKWFDDFKNAKKNSQ